MGWVLSLLGGGALRVLEEICLQVVGEGKAK